MDIETAQEVVGTCRKLDEQSQVENTFRNLALEWAETYGARWTAPHRKQVGVVLSDHPHKDLSVPALAFPCQLEQFQEFIEWAGLIAAVDVEELAAFKARSEEERLTAEAFVANLRMKAATGRLLQRSFSGNFPR